MKKIFAYTAFSLLVLSGCSSDPEDPVQNPTENEIQEQPEDKPEDDPEKPVEELTDISPLLCCGQRFVDRETETFSSSTLGEYTAVVTQKEYQFFENGEGTLTEYVAENTPRGFVQTVNEFTWHTEPSSSPVLDITVDNGEILTLSNVEVVDKGLFSSEEIWTKEISLEAPLSEDDVVSYSVEMKYEKGYDYNYGGMLGLVTSPAMLSVETKEGQVVFITHIYGSNTVLNPIPANGSADGFVYNDSYVYAKVDLVNPYPYSFFEIITGRKEIPFVEDDCMYFYLGMFDSENGDFSMIKSGEKHKIK